MPSSSAKHQKMMPDSPIYDAAGELSDGEDVEIVEARKTVDAIIETTGTRVCLDLDINLHEVCIRN